MNKNMRFRPQRNSVKNGNRIVKRKKKQRVNNRVLILNEAGRFAPDRLYCILKYNDTSLSRTGSGTHNVMNWRYRSSAFDPDPLLVTGAIPGFNELAVLYKQYRVEKMVADAEFNNQETVATIAGAWPGNQNHGSNVLTASDIVEFSSNYRGKYIMMGNTTGQSRGRLTVTADLMQLVGPNGFTDLDYSSDVSTNPVTAYYLNFGVANTLSNFSFAVPTKISIQYHICFYSLRQLEA